MEKEIGIIEHFFGHLSVAALKLTDGTLKVGDTIHVKGHTTDFTEKIRSLGPNPLTSYKQALTGADPLPASGSRAARPGPDRSVC